jgi:(2Fe-2S) ferredoxin
MSSSAATAGLMAMRAAPAPASGSDALRDYMKARAKELGLPGIRINSAGCLDRCELGPTMVIYPEGSGTAQRRARMWTRSSPPTCRTAAAPRG